MSTKPDIAEEIHSLSGIPGAAGKGIGRPMVLDSQKTVVKPEKISENQVSNELELADLAIEKLSDELEKLKSISAEKEARQIIESQIQVLNDPEIKNGIHQNISDNKFGAVYAIFSSFNQYIQLFEKSAAEWMNDRTIDISSIRDQLIDVVKNQKPVDLNADNAVVFAEDISPTQMIKLCQSDVAGIVTHKGGLTSHTVILAQSLGIPCIIGLDWRVIKPGHFKDVLIDGDNGVVFFDPPDSEREKFEAYLQKKNDLHQKALAWAEKPNKTSCGSKFSIRANVEFISELPHISTHGAEGVGLLRTETILFETEDFDVENQVEFYRQVAEASGDNQLTIRLFDAGGDKLTENHENELNPFLGWRGIRMLLDKPDLLRQQLEAILRVSGFFPGKIKILVPMISHIEQIGQTKNILQEVKQSLMEQDAAYDAEIQFGIMIEVPGIAMMAGEAAEEVDFFSIGSNDLTQYMLAVDRGNGKISDLYQPSHPSIWRIIHYVIENSREAGTPLSICGQMASKPLFAACFLGMGLNDLSMNTNSIPAVKALLCNHSMDEFRDLSNQVLQQKTHNDVRNVFEEWSNRFDLK